MLQRTILKSSEVLPVIGLGSWQTMNVQQNSEEFETLRKVWSYFFSFGGRVIDSSPMYGKAENTIGQLKRMQPVNAAFYATKVWTRGEEMGKKQIQRSFELLQTDFIDLFQIHNLLDSSTHLKTLRDLKEKGKIRYIGLTHFVPSAFAEMEQLVQSHPIDFLQIPFSILTRDAEERLLPFALENKISILVNRPFEEGALFSRVKGKQVPDYFKQWNCETFSQCFLKYIISHPAVTCVIPATGKLNHLIDNMHAGMGPIPNELERGEFRKRLLSILN